MEEFLLVFEKQARGTLAACWLDVVIAVELSLSLKFPPTSATFETKNDKQSYSSNDFWLSTTLFQIDSSNRKKLQNNTCTRDKVWLVKIMLQQPLSWVEINYRTWKYLPNSCCNLFCLFVRSLHDSSKTKPKLQNTWWCIRAFHRIQLNHNHYFRMRTVNVYSVYTPCNADDLFSQWLN